MSRIKISKPERLPREGVSDVDLHTWKNELLNYLSQDDVFEKFCDDGPYSSWEAAKVINSDLVLLLNLILNKISSREENN